MRRGLELAALIVLVAGCGDPPSTGCAERADCPTGQVCTDGACVPGGMDGGAEDAGAEDAGEAADAGATCPTAVLCGTPPACCGADEECLGGACAPICESGVRCGADRSVCCGDGQVCVSEACTDVGTPCADSFDCPEGAFCEPTLGRCLPQFDPVTCAFAPDFGDFTPALEWSAASFAEAPDHVNSIVMPAVIDLDGDAEPELVTAFFTGTGSECRGVVRALRGGTGEVLWTVGDIGGDDISACPTFAVGDLTGDGAPEIVTMRTDGRIVALDADGALLWLSENADGTPYSAGGYLSWANAAFVLANLDDDPEPEIVVGAVVLDADGTVLWVRDAATMEGDNGGYAGGLPAVADIDLDGEPEIVTGRRAYEADGTERWAAATTDGYPAIGDFDADPQPEIVLVTEGAVVLLDGVTGAVEWGPVTIPGGGRGGPPTVADFDGDGAPEIGVAGGSSYSVYDPGGPDDVLWSRPTQDASSNATGSAVFDFQGDGAAEVIYADECYLRAYRGSDGEVLLEIENSSGTQHEYPVVADVDADGNSEIVIVANDNNATVAANCRSRYPGWVGERHGVFVYGDSMGRWVRTRRIWNQHTYHVTNVDADGTIPAVEVANWSAPDLNNYRQNVQGEGVFNAPNLTVTALEVSLVGCPDAVTLRARIANEGSLGVAAGAPVTFREGTIAAPGAVLGTVATTVALLPGASAVVELEVPLSGAAPYAFVATVDDDGTGAGVVAECHEDDNGEGIGGVDCDILF